MSIRIKRIKAINFKGLSFEESLAPANVFVGDNYSGKTARTELIRWVLVGYLLELGKRNSDTFGLSCGREMTGEVELEDGRVLRRRLYLKGDSVKEEVTIPEEFEGSTLVPVMLDAGEYFALSERDRVAFVFRNCPAGDLDLSPAAIRTRLDALPDIPQRSAVIDRIFDKVEVGDPPTAYLDTLVAVADDETKAAREQSRRMEQTLQGLSGLRAADDTAVVQEIDVSPLRLELEQIQRRMGELAGETDSRKRARLRRLQIEELLKGKDALAKRLAELLKKLPPATPADDKTKLHEAIETKVAEQARLRAAYIKARDDVAQTEAKIEALDTEQREISEKTVCPYCGATGEGWKALRLSKNIEERNKLIGELATFVLEKTTKSDRGTALTAEIVGLRDQLNALDTAERARTSEERSIATLREQLVRLEPMAEELERLGDQDPEGPAAEVRTLYTKTTGIRAQILAAEDTNRAAAQRTADKRRLAQAETQRDDAKKELEAANAVTAALREIRADAVDRAFRPMLADANRFAAAVLVTPLAYSRERNELGTLRDGIWVSHRVFSGTEKAIAYAAIQAALAARAPLRLMIVDELGRLRDKHVRELIKAACAAIVAGSLDQFVGIDIAEPLTPRHRLYEDASASDSRFKLIEI